MSRKNISQPDEWWLAFQTEADKHGQSLSEWMGDCCRANLPKAVDVKLPDRPAAHRPKKARITVPGGATGGAAHETTEDDE